jgi:hypothetical protein
MNYTRLNTKNFNVPFGKVKVQILSDNEIYKLSAGTEILCLLEPFAMSNGFQIYSELLKREINANGYSVLVAEKQFHKSFKSQEDFERNIKITHKWSVEERRYVELP